jgi:hypothetical protein
MLPDYIRVEDNLLGLIFKKFNLNFPLSDTVHKIDRELLEYEYNIFYDYTELDFTYWSPEESKSKFLARFFELTRQIEKNERITN